MVVLYEFSECVAKSDAYLDGTESNSFTSDKPLATAGIMYLEKGVCSISTLIRYVTNHENPNSVANRSPGDSKMHPTVAFIARGNGL